MTLITEKTIPWTPPPTNSHVDNFRNEFDRIYDNTIVLDTRLQAYQDAFTALTSGRILGGLYASSAGAPAGIQSGHYEVNGVIVKLSADMPPSYGSHPYGEKAVQVDQWYLTLLDENGTASTQLATGPAISSAVTTPPRPITDCS